MNARFVILRVLLEAGQGLLQLRVVRRTDDPLGDDVQVVLDRTKIATVGREAIRHFLLRLQVTGHSITLSHLSISPSMYVSLHDCIVYLTGVQIDCRL